MQAFVDEINQIQTYLEKGWLLLAEKRIQYGYDTCYKELEEINTKLWGLEDEVRLHAKNDGADGYLLGCYRKITQLNDQRAEAVKRVNKLFGIDSQEKLHA